MVMSFPFPFCKQEGRHDCVWIEGRKAVASPNETIGKEKALITSPL